MAQDTRALRDRIEERRSDITETVGQIENRVMPGRIVARRSARVRQTLSGWKEAVLGSDDGDGSGSGTWDPYSRAPRGSTQHAQDGDEGILGRAGSAAASARHEVGEAVHDAPDMVRRRAAGNPVTAGAVALGIGWIVGSAMPKTERERAMARRVEPALAGAAHGVVHQGQEVVEEMREPVRDAVDRVEHVGAEAAGDLRDEAKGAARTVRDQAQGS